MKQLIAKHPMNHMVIIERFIDGTRYLKVTPKHIFPVILDTLKKQFLNTNVEVEASETGWIKITNEGGDPKLIEAAEKIMGDDKSVIDKNYILNKEADMLKKQGFIVTVEDV